MPKLHYKDKILETNEDETVLRALLRNELPVPYACGVGICHCCMMRSTATPPPPKAQQGLKATLKKEGYFLACLCRPTEDMTLEDVDSASQIVDAHITERRWLTEDILSLTLRTHAPFSYHAGQFVGLKNTHGLMRSYSLASVPALHEDPQVHIRLRPQGAMSRWLRDHAHPETPVQLQGPHGECFYLPEEPERPLLLVGTGTGLAPLYGLLRDALAHKHHGPITLYHGALHTQGLYLTDTLEEIAAAHPNVSYIRCLRDGTPAKDVYIGDIAQIIKDQISDFKSLRTYLCGDPDLVKRLQKQLFLAGVPLQSIHADPFLPASP